MSEPRPPIRECGHKRGGVKPFPTTPKPDVIPPSQRKVTAKARSGAGVLKWTPIQIGRFYLRSMKERRITARKYFAWLVKVCGVKDTPAQRCSFYYCLDLATKELEQANSDGGGV